MSSIYCLIICRSLTYAQRAGRAIERSGITAVVVRTPYKIAPSGCSYSVKISQNKLSEALAALKRMGAEHLGAYVLNADGTCREVAVP